MKRVCLLITLIIVTYGSAQRDYRHFQSPVKNQGARGTCTAFGVAAAIESQPAVPADVSEQYLYAALKFSQPDKPYREGDILKNYVNSLKTYGVVHESVMPYEPNALPWENAPTEFMRKIQGAQTGQVGLLNAHKYAKFGFKDEIIYYNSGQSQDIAFLKSLFDAGYLAIPVSYDYIHLGTWSDFTSSATNPFLPTIQLKTGDTWKRYIDIYKTYEGNLIEDIVSGKIPYALLNRTSVNEAGDEVSNYGGHVVTLVGYNDKGFIFKNSWGTDWGDHGYGYISYDAHRIMAREAMIFNGIQVYNTALVKNKNKQVDIKLKSSGNAYGGKQTFMLSLFTVDPNENINMDKVHYKVYDPKGNLLSEATLDAPQSTSNTYLWEPFKDKLMPPDFLIHKGYIKVVATITTNRNELTRTYRLVQNKAQEYSAQEIQENNIIIGDDTVVSNYKQQMPIPSQNIGFGYPCEAFKTALEKTNLSYNTVSTLDHFLVFYENQEFIGIQYVFEKGKPVLTYIIIYFKSQEEARKYLAKNYPKQQDYFKKEYDYTHYEEGIPFKIQAWNHEHKIYVATNMAGSQYSNL